MHDPVQSIYSYSPTIRPVNTCRSYAQIYVRHCPPFLPQSHLVLLTWSGGTYANEFVRLTVSDECFILWAVACCGSSSYMPCLMQGESELVYIVCKGYRMLLPVYEAGAVLDGFEDRSPLWIVGIVQANQDSWMDHNSATRTNFRKTESEEESTETVSHLHTSDDSPPKESQAPTRQDLKLP
jgi:hypothetical protein